MAEPTLVREGNLRLASLASRGYPPDPWRQGREVARQLAGQEVEAYGPLVILFNLSPEDQPLSEAECQVGRAIVGLGRSQGSMVIEDYHQLTALTMPHKGAIRELPDTWRRLHEKARALGRISRPYWRLALGNRRLADGNLLPYGDVSLFVER